MLQLCCSTSLASTLDDDPSREDRGQSLAFEDDDDDDDDCDDLNGLDD